MVTVLKACIAQPGVSLIRIATGYWDIPGMALIVDELKQFLERDETHLKLLIGKDPYVYAKMLKEPEYQDKKYPSDFIRIGIEKLSENLRDEYRDAIDLLLKYCEGDKPKIEIHIFRNEEAENQFLHSKCYIFTHGYNDSPTIAIIGSSNFTEKGLCGNAELNYLDVNRYVITYEQAGSKVKGHIAWFEEKWGSSVDWTQEFLIQVLKTTETVKKIKDATIHEDGGDIRLTPYELYIKLLQYNFSDMLDKDSTAQIEDYLPERFERLQYQIDAVKQCFSIMQEHGGFLLADVVGLGKTVVGTMIIKRFLSIPDVDNRKKRVLVVTPPAIKRGWEETIKEFDEGKQDKIAPNIDFITTGSIGKLVDIEEDEADAFEIDGDVGDTGNFNEELKCINYGLIIVDESHKFRNSGTAMYNSLNSLISTINNKYGYQPYIGLISATPQNNSPKDLQNQIYLFERYHTNSTLKKACGGNIEDFFSKLQGKYEELTQRRYNDPNSRDYVRHSLDERKRELENISVEIREKVLEDIMVRRTRTDINKYYANRENNPALKFPEVLPPERLEYVLTGDLVELFSYTMNVIKPVSPSNQQNSLLYSRYRAIEYLTDREVRRLYETANRSVSELAQQLAEIMQTLLAKRLESSFDAFRGSLENLQRYTQNMINMWNHDCIFIAPQLDVNAEFDDREFEDVAQSIRQKIERLNQQGRNPENRNREFHRADFNQDYIKHLEHDSRLLESLANKWKGKNDPKKNEFRKAIRKLLPSEARDTKMVIFTESAETLRSVVRVVEEEGIKVLPVTAANRHQVQEQIAQNFDANFKGEKRYDYQVIVTTDVLAEGVNLHRANIIINYDTPWNATKLMQRIGRINRIGSPFDQIHVYNFMPSAEVDAMLQLVSRAFTKIQLFHSTFGEDNQIFISDEEVVHYDINTSENYEEEESPWMKYIEELWTYHEKYPKRYEEILACNDPAKLAAAITSEPRNSLFMLRNASTKAYYINVPANGPSCPLSLSQMLELFHVPCEVVTAELPESAQDLKWQAKLFFYNEMENRLKLFGKQRRKQARNILDDIQNNYPNISHTARQAISDARIAIDAGNEDVCRALFSIKKLIDNPDGDLLPLQMDEIETMLARSKPIRNIMNQNQECEVFLALYK